MFLSSKNRKYIFYKNNQILMETLSSIFEASLDYDIIHADNRIALVTNWREQIKQIVPFFR